MTQPTPAGWYADPHDVQQLRWWDGSQWTAHVGAVQPTALTPAPGPSPKGKAAIICPHCQVRGRVRSRRVQRKQGVSGGKATAAVFTLGFSMLATGLSRKQWVTRMRCANCRTVWYV